MIGERKKRLILINDEVMLISIDAHTIFLKKFRIDSLHGVNVKSSSTSSGLKTCRIYLCQEAIEATEENMGGGELWE